MKSFLIIGAGKFGRYLCRELSEQGGEILMVDKNEEKLSDLLPLVVSAKIGDCTRKEVLRSFGVNNFEACVVCIEEDFQSSLEITDLLHELGARYIVSLASTEVHKKFLLRSGADEVVFPDRDIAQRMAVSIINDSVFDYIELSDGYSIYEITPPAKWLGRTIGEVNVRAKHHISILAVKAQGRIRMMPSVGYKFSEEEHLMVMGLKEDIDKIV